MRVADLLKPETILVDAPVNSWEEALDALFSLHEKAGNLTDTPQFRRDVSAREQQGGTALTHGVAIPHARSGAAAVPAIAALTVSGGLACGSLDGEPTDLFFMLAAPLEENAHIEALGALSRLLIDETFREELRRAESPVALWEAVRRREETSAGPAAGNPAEESPAGKYRVLAVTACPAGLAHTYMAAEAITEAAEHQNCTLKVETNGAGGAENVLTAREIEAADCIVVAADRAVDLERFAGKPVLWASVGEGVRHPEELLEKALSGSVPVYGGGKDGEKSGGERLSHRIYRHLMNGVSYMMPLVVAGGVLIALSYLLDDYRLGAATLGTNTKPAEFLNILGNTAFGFMLPVFSAFIAQSIADRPGLAAGFVGGLLAKQGVCFTCPGGTVSAGFFGALLAGFAAGLLVKGMKRLTKKLPPRMDSVRTILLYPVGGVLLVGVVMFTVNPLLSAVNTMFTRMLNSMGEGGSIALGVALGAMMAVDMGGPLSKSAYVFGTVAISAGDYDVMAAVMLGGMVPPLVTALASTVFPKYFSRQEHKNGMVNYVLGLCFITEGAIPFAAADPLRVIPSCMLGSAVAGGLSMAFGCTLIAPHGGLFVFPLVGNVGGYLIALAAGSLCGMGLLALLKRKRRSTKSPCPVKSAGAAHNTE